MARQLTMGSLFDGSGSFPYVAQMCGIKPVWASEVEPYPIRVSSKRFPEMKHIGDVSKAKGSEIEPADIITFGSPCQSLSVAGKREGIRHKNLDNDEMTQSGLFIEAIRIIREMRESTNGKYPTIILWENVPGAFSSSGGEDFRTVLEQIESIATNDTVHVPRPPESWAAAGSVLGHDYSIAWRTLDAQYWGVPQRRRRIYLVADFGGQRAIEILFKREGLYRDFKTGREKGKGTSGNTKKCFGAEGKKCITIEPGLAQRKGGHYYENLAGTLRAQPGDNRLAVAYAEDAITSPDNGSNPQPGDPHHTLTATGAGRSIICLESHPNDSRVRIAEDGICQTLTSAMGKGGGNVPLIMDDANALLGTDRENDDEKQETFGFAANTGGTYGMPMTKEIAPTLKAKQNDASIVYKKPDKVMCLNGDVVMHGEKGRGNGNGWREDTSYTLTAHDTPAVVYENTTQGDEPIAVTNVGFVNWDEEGKAFTLCASDYKHPQVCCYGEGGSESLLVETENEKTYIVRKLTPRECSRLQGLPDYWQSDLGTENSTEEELQFWREVFETYRKITGRKKEKTDKQIIRWLKNPYSESADYKMIGNGIAIPTALYVMEGIAEALKEG